MNVLVTYICVSSHEESFTYLHFFLTLKREKCYVRMIQNNEQVTIIGKFL